MRLILMILLIGSSLTLYSQTQLDVNKQANDSFQKADKELNDIYKKILVEYKSDTLFIKNLKASQRLWIMFRDAELKVKFPDPNIQTYGSIYPFCVSKYLEQITRDRIQTLRQWFDGIEEGDECIGSVKIKE